MSTYSFEQLGLINGQEDVIVNIHNKFVREMCRLIDFCRMYSLLHQTAPSERGEINELYESISYNSKSKTVKKKQEYVDEKRIHISELIDKHKLPFRGKDEVRAMNRLEMARQLLEALDPPDLSKQYKLLLEVDLESYSLKDWTLFNKKSFQAIPVGQRRFTQESFLEQKDGKSIEQIIEDSRVTLSWFTLLKKIQAEIEILTNQDDNDIQLSDPSNRELSDWESISFTEYDLQVFDGSVEKLANLLSSWFKIDLDNKKIYIQDDKKKIENNVCQFNSFIHRGPECSKAYESHPVVVFFRKIAMSFKNRLVVFLEEISENNKQFYCLYQLLHIDYRDNRMLDEFEKNHPVSYHRFEENDGNWPIELYTFRNSNFWQNIADDTQENSTDSQKLNKNKDHLSPINTDVETDNKVDTNAEASTGIEVGEGEVGDAIQFTSDTNQPPVEQAGHVSTTGQKSNSTTDSAIAEIESKKPVATSKRGSYKNLSRETTLTYYETEVREQIAKALRERKEPDGNNIHESARRKIMQSKDIKRRTFDNYLPVPVRKELFGKLCQQVSDAKRLYNR